MTELTVEQVYQEQLKVLHEEWLNPTLQDNYRRKKHVCIAMPSSLWTPEVRKEFLANQSWLLTCALRTVTTSWKQSTVRHLEMRLLVRGAYMAIAEHLTDDELATFIHGNWEMTPNTERFIKLRDNL